MENLAAGFALLEKIVAVGPSLINAGATFIPMVETAYQVITSKLTGQAATDAIAKVEADIDSHVAHMNVEAAKLGT